MARPFFFSYAHNDTRDGYLDEFFDEVNRRAGPLVGSKEDGFRDDLGLRAGEVWSDALAKELVVSPAMVCMYSPSYFTSSVCAQELQVFLERREQYIDQGLGGVPGGIIPVLWLPPLRRIPIAVPELQYEGPSRKSKFKDAGVWNVRDAGTRKEFNAIAQQVALRIKDAFNSSLPTLKYQPVLGGVRSAFEPPSLPPKEFNSGVRRGTREVIFVYAHAPAWNAWPFTPASDPLLHISTAVAKGRDLRSHQLTFDPSQPSFLSRLDEVRRRNNLMILFVDGASLADNTLGARLREFDSRAYLAATVVVWRSGSRPADFQQLAARAFPSQSLKRPPFFDAGIDSPDTFSEAVARGLDTLKTQIDSELPGIAHVESTSAFTEIPSISASPRAA